MPKTNNIIPITNSTWYVTLLFNVLWFDVDNDIDDDGGDDIDNVLWCFVKFDIDDSDNIDDIDIGDDDINNETHLLR